MSEHSARAATRRADWLVVTTAEPGYAEGVVADMSRIGGTASGRLLLERIRASGYGVVIQKPDLIDPPNAWVPRQGDADCVVAYDARQWPNQAHPSVPASDVLLFAMLRQALDQLLGAARPSRGRVGEPVVIDDEAVAGYQRERDDV